MKPDDFIEQYKKDAQECEEQTGVPMLVTLAQAALESGWGAKAPGNNFFGIKASKDTPAEQKQLIVTTEYHDNDKVKYPGIISIAKLEENKYRYKVSDWFVKYDSAAESFIDHGNFLKKNKRYAKAFEEVEPYAFAHEIAEAGYATDPHYDESLHDVIRSVDKRIL